MSALTTDDAAGYIKAADHMQDLLRKDLANVRQALADAERLTYKYAQLIGELKEQRCLAGTVCGIANNIRRLKPGDLKPGDVADIAAALSGLCTGMVAHGWGEMQHAVNMLDDAHTWADDLQAQLDGVTVTEVQP